jgi:hypothetical protein
MKQILLFIFASVWSIQTYILQAQSTPFQILIEPISITGLGGIQSYAWGQHNGKWLIVGGRLDGLHRRQPWASFDVAGHNNQLIVIDPVSMQKWTAPLSSLPTSVQEHVSSTNMEFYQEGDILYFLGGYGYSASSGDHITYPYLTAIHVPDVINAIINNTPFHSSFRQISDSQFQVTGGRLRRIHDTYYLLGGQKFMGRYNPMGPNNGPGFIQEYTNSIRKFKITDNWAQINITHLPSHFDTVELHRRDYNAEAQIFPNGEEGITMFSGVFQYNADLPFLNAINVDSLSYTPNPGFSQYYNHYHCPAVPVYSHSQNLMHTVFFGGIAQYYDVNGTLVQDNNVPFVKTIARVTRDANGIMSEYKLPIEMPTLLGAGAEFIVNKNVPHYANEVIKLDDLTADTTHIGYIYGGIASSAPNIFFTNDGTQSTASSDIFKVSLIRNTMVSSDALNEQSINSLEVMVYPNPNNGNFEIIYNLKKSGDVNIVLYSLDGKKIDEQSFKNQSEGKHVYSRKIKQLTKGGTFMLLLESNTEKAVQKIIIEP